MNRFSSLVLATLLVATLLTAAGCATDTRARELKSTLDLYRKTLRWESPRTAAQFIDPDMRPDPRQLDFHINRMAQFNVTGYSLLGPGNYDTQGQFTQSVEIRLENRHTAVERVIVDHQRWRWDDGSERWWLVSGLPKLERG